jgi:hypothetical protein
MEGAIPGRLGLGNRCDVSLVVMVQNPMGVRGFGTVKFF